MLRDNSYIKEPFYISAQLDTKFHSNEKISGSGSVIQVLPQETLLLVENNIPAIRSATLAPNGFCNNSRWVSFAHNFKHRSLQDFLPCFSNKTVYFLGDSTTRQFFDLLSDSLHLKVHVSDSSKYYHVPRYGRNDNHNISIYYRAHGLPIRNPGPPYLAPYISDTISSINYGGPSVALYINIGLHYVEYNPAIFIHRLKGIKQALMEHSRKYPQTKIIIKGMNVSNLKRLPFEWLIYRQNVILREFCKAVTNCLFIDLWDMTTLWPLTADYHPNGCLLIEQANVMFSKLCD